MKYRIIKITTNSGSVAFYAQIKQHWFSGWKYLSSVGDMFRFISISKIFKYSDCIPYCADELVTQQKANEIIEAHKKQQHNTYLRQIKQIEII